MNSDLIVTFFLFKIQMHKMKLSNKRFQILNCENAEVINKLQKQKRILDQIHKKFAGDLTHGAVMTRESEMRQRARLGVLFARYAKIFLVSNDVIEASELPEFWKTVKSFFEICIPSIGAR